MELGERCESSGNYIAEIETGRRTPSFEKVEQIAAALHIASYKLFIHDDAPGLPVEEEPLTTAESLDLLPAPVKSEIVSRLMAAIRKDVVKALDGKTYTG